MAETNEQWCNFFLKSKFFFFMFHIFSYQKNKFSEIIKSIFDMKN